MMYRSCAVILVILTGLVAVYSHANAPLGAQVTVSTGVLSGIRSSDGLKQFFHIPYAKPPLGELRWLPPQPAGYNRTLTASDASGRTAVAVSFGEAVLCVGQSSA